MLCQWKLINVLISITAIIKTNNNVSIVEYWNEMDGLTKDVSCRRHSVGVCLRQAMRSTRTFCHKLVTSWFKTSQKYRNFTFKFRLQKQTTWWQWVILHSFRYVVVTERVPPHCFVADATSILTSVEWVLQVLHNSAVGVWVCKLHTRLRLSRAVYQRHQRGPGPMKFSLVWCGEMRRPWQKLNPLRSRATFIVIKNDFEHNNVKSNPNCKRCLMPPSPGNSSCDKLTWTLSPAEAPNVAAEKEGLIFSGLWSCCRLWSW